MEEVDLRRYLGFCISHGGGWFFFDFGMGKSGLVQMLSGISRGLRMYVGRGKKGGVSRMLPGIQSVLMTRGFRFPGKNVRFVETSSSSGNRGEGGGGGGSSGKDPKNGDEEESFDSIPEQRKTELLGRVRVTDIQRNFFGFQFVTKKIEMPLDMNLTQEEFRFVVKKMAAGKQLKQEEEKKATILFTFGKNDKSKEETSASGWSFLKRPEIIVLISVMAYLWLSEGQKDRFSSGIPEISFQEFLDSSHFKEGTVQKLVVLPSQTHVAVYLSDRSSVVDDVSSHSQLPSFVFSIGSLESFERNLKDAIKDLDEKERRGISVIYEPPAFKTMFDRSQGGGNLSNWLLGFELLLTSVPLLFLGWIFFRGRPGSNGGGNPLTSVFNVGKSKAKLYNAETCVRTTFKDVAGMEESKVEVAEFVKFLKEPQVYEALGARIPKGAILSGPPGTGKTLLARAMAGEAGVPFLSISGAEFVEMFVGVGAARVRDLFSEARKLAPCIVFIDEIDAIGRARGRNAFGGGNDERESTLNQLLVEMDGFSSGEKTGKDSKEIAAPIIVMAGTNRPDILDAALLRPGRFDRHISIERPDSKGRKAIYLVHMKPLRLDPHGPSPDDIASKLAYMTPGFVGADMANVCNEAALLAARVSSAYVTEMHLEAAVERVIAGVEKQSRVLSVEERNLVAHHEAGHVTAAWFLEHADPVMKVTIIPRSSGALGFARTLPSDSVLVSRAQLEDRLCVALGGRVAEEVIFGKNAVTSGAQNDLQKVTAMAYDAVTVLGMDDEIGPISFPNRDDDRYARKSYSEDTARLIDLRVKAFIELAYEKTRTLLLHHQDKLKTLAKELLEKESVYREDLERILGARPFAPKHAYDLSRLSPK